MQIDGGDYTDFDYFKPLVASYQSTDHEGFGLAFKGLNLKDYESKPNEFFKYEGKFQSEFIYDDEYQEMQVGINPNEDTEPGVYKFYVRQTITSFWKLIATITITN